MIEAWQDPARAASARLQLARVQGLPRSAG